ncbi:zinc ABC transporter ATP-binding protein AztA [Ketogulonicigenium vulgare]|uniref:zinc ABC transporter ATP-binding protein AztA n=1 Tax=Ketogulonicigenium vulgare TaxID=92945 RepID=UPI0023597204|nr:zinc ABC transporter ATP-binding protein AztA [Ketogulonicigenium vulgare]
MPILTIDNLTLGYGNHAAVHHLGGSIARGEKLAVVGGNGSGKSTLLKGIVGLLRPMGGRITRAEGTRIAYLPQSAEVDRSFPARVIDLVSLGLWAERGLWRKHSADDRARLQAALARVGLAGFENRPLDALSGGQFQRALFARVIVQQADIILLDEPFNGIDQPTEADLLRLIAGWHAEGRTILTVLHDLDTVRTHFPRALLLARDPIAWGPTADVLTPLNLARARGFAEAWDDSAPICDEPPHEHLGGHDHDHGHDHFRKLA